MGITLLFSDTIGKCCQSRDNGLQLHLPTHPDFNAVLFAEFTRQAEVDDSEIVVVAFLGEDDVKRLQVKMQPSVGVDELYPCRER